MPRLRALLDRMDIDEPIELVRVESPEAAEQQRFLGSPTLRIDGVDVEPAAGERTDYGLKCRLYPVDRRGQPLPAEQWVVAALGRSRGQPQEPRPG